tara:strand:+ start:1574 stop:1798 length:225 start_codon:yes stop_codon:yes gene_type:complete
MDNPKLLTAEEYNCIVLAITKTSDYLAKHDGSKKDFYETIFNKLFNVTLSDMIKNLQDEIRQEEISKPITEIEN